jgi:Fe-S-cluster containining protein
VTRENPCLSCGACCAFYRVSFYWGETTDVPEGTVPAHLTEDITPFYRAMKGSNQKHPHCIALEGEIGKSVRCNIYERRPSSCRDFGLDFNDGQVVISPEDYERCTHARAAWGLLPIQIDVSQAIQTVPARSPRWPLIPSRKRRKKPGGLQRPPDQNPIFPPPV